MSDRCPTCGQRITEGIAQEAERLLRLLQGDRKRYVYQGDRSNRWFVTDGGGEFRPEAVSLLVKRGDIVSCYSDCPYDAYHVGKTIDTARTTARRKTHSRAIVYVGDP